MTQTVPRIAVVGAGAWGCALACAGVRAGARVSLWSRTPLPRNAQFFPRLPEIAIPPEIDFVATPPLDVDVTLLAVPTQFLRATLSNLSGTSPLIACCKGIELHSAALPLDILTALHPSRKSGVLSGPNLASEVGQALPAAATIAAARVEDAKHFMTLISSKDFRLYASDDPIGVQIAAATKNVIAIGAGFAVGAGLGLNARAALVARAVAEISRLVVAQGGRATTVAGLSGVGDLMLTCTGGESRNYSLGAELGKGRKLSAILASRTTVAEGVTTAPALLQLAQSSGVSMPIVETVAALLKGDLDGSQAQRRLLDRPLTVE